MSKLILLLVMVLVTGILGTCLLLYTVTVMKPDFPMSILIDFILGVVACILVLVALITAEICK